MIQGLLSTQGFKLKNFEDLVQLKQLDYSQERIISHLNAISLYLWSETYTSLLRVNLNDNWWASKIKAKKMLKLFEVASGTESNVYKALLFCFSHQSSTKSLYQLTRALFGEHAHIEFEILKHELHIKTDIDNTNFTKALMSKNHEWLTTHNQKGMIAETFDRLGTSQITLFLEQFLGPGKKLTLTITHNSQENL